MKRVVDLVYDRFQLLDLAGPLTAFEIAGLYTRGGYGVEIVASGAGPVATTRGLRLDAADLRQVGQFDILIVPGGYGIESVVSDSGVLDFFRRAAADGWPVFARGRSYLRGPGFCEAGVQRLTGAKPQSWPGAIRPRTSTRNHCLSRTGTYGPPQE